MNDERICQALGQMLTRVGIQTTVQALPFATWIAAASRQDYSMLFGGWGIDTAEASSPLGSLLATFDRATGQGASNRSRYSNPEVDRAGGRGRSRRSTTSGATPDLHPRDGDRDARTSGSCRCITR